MLRRFYGPRHALTQGSRTAVLAIADGRPCGYVPAFWWAHSCQNHGGGLPPHPGVEASVAAAPAAFQQSS